MSISFWVIVSWIFVLILTGINVFVFLKLKQASEQMMKMAFPGAGNMNEALAQMQQMMGAMGGGGGGGMGAMGAPGRAGARGGFQTPARTAPAGGGGGAKNMDAQLKAAMDMLNQMQKKAKK